MKKFYLLFLGCCVSILSVFAAEQAGEVIANPNPVTDLTQVTFSYDATATFDGETYLYAHLWVNLKSGETLSQGTNSTDWNNLRDEQEMEDNGGDRQFSVTVNISELLGWGAGDAEKIASIGVLVRNSMGSDQTASYTIGVGEAIQPGDRFSFNMGKGSDWSDYQFVKDENDATKFTLSVTVPADFADGYQFWVGYNGGGITNPGWTEGQSMTLALSEIPGIIAGENTLEISSTSTLKNWGITANGADLPTSDRFKISYGIQGESGWVDVEFTKDEVDANLFNATVTLPQDFSTISFYVGYNGGGSDAPGWVEGKSNTVLINTIPNIKAGENTLTVSKTSEAENWGITAGTSTGLVENTLQGMNYSIENNVLTVTTEDAANISIYTVSGQLVNQVSASKVMTSTLNNGIYIVRVNSQSFKVMAK